MAGCLASDGCLLDKYGHRVVYDAGSSVGAKLSTIIRNGEWYWPYARTDRLVELQSKLPEVEITNSDLPVWSCKKGKYMCAETWDTLRSGVESGGYPSAFLLAVVGFQRCLDH